MAEDEDRPDAAEDEDASALRRLMARLEQADELYPKDHLHGATAALDAVLEFLFVLGIKHRAPLTHLLSALHSIPMGRVPKWLKSKSSGTSRLIPPDLMFRAGIVGTLEFLVEAGIDSDEATRMIGMSSGEKNITITKWHKRLSSHSSSVLDLEKIAAQVKAGLHVRASAYGKEVAIKLAIEAIKAKRREL